MGNYYLRTVKIATKQVVKEIPINKTEYNNIIPSNNITEVNNTQVNNTGNNTILPVKTTGENYITSPAKPIETNNNRVTGGYMANIMPKNQTISINTPAFAPNYGNASNIFVPNSIVTQEQANIIKQFVKNI